MSIIQTQTFAFAPPQIGVSETVQSNPISGVMLDGSASVTVPFLTPFAQYVKSVNVQYTPATDTGYQIVTEVLPIAPATTLAESLTGFVLFARGGPAEAGTFTYTADGL